MFWGCFSYDKKGPCHCWTPETNKEKEAVTMFHHHKVLATDG